MQRRGGIGCYLEICLYDQCNVIFDGSAASSSTSSALVAAALLDKADKDVLSEVLTADGIESASPPTTKLTATRVGKKIVAFPILHLSLIHI